MTLQNMPLVSFLLVTVLTTAELLELTPRALNSSEDKVEKSINQSSTIQQQLPKCVQVTFQPHQFKYIDSATIQVGIGYDIGPVVNYSYSSNDNSSIDMCFPLSPQLQECVKRCHPRGSYYVKNLTLYNESSHIIAELGDYYMDNQGNAITCKQTIAPGRRIRCNYFKLLREEYHMFSNGTLYSAMLKKTIQRPIISALDSGSQALNLCYPLDITLLNCDPCRHEQLPSKSYELRSDYTIYVPLWKFTVDIGDYYYKNNNDIDPYICRPSRTFRVAKWNSDLILVWVYKTSYVISAFLLTMAAVTQASLRKLTSYDKCLLYHNISIAIFYIHAVFCWYNNYCDFQSVAACCFFFCVGYLSHLSIYCWLTACAFDVWKSFNQLEIPQVVGHFGIYSLFGFGVPMTLCIFVLVLNFTPSLMSLLALNFHIECMTLFIDSKSRLVFYTIPLMLIAIINITLFILTLHNIKCAIRDVQIAKSKPKRQMFTICLKLFIVSGVGLLVEGIIGSLNEPCGAPFKPYWYIPDAVLSVQGLAISCIIIWRKDIQRQYSSFIYRTCQEFRLRISMILTKAPSSRA